MGRWSIEVMFRDVKQIAHGEDPQSWKYKGPERAASLSYWLHAATWCWYITTYGASKTWPDRPWYPKKTAPSFLDALAALRLVLWQERITTISPTARLDSKMMTGVLEVLSRAA